MRLVTYLGLVTRRLWAKRGILVGSLLGAILVTALLVVVPLYQDSVKAVDLRFSVQSAPADEVDLTAFVQMLNYSGTEAAANRELISDLRQTQVAKWYPTSVERLQSREFFIIPTGGAIDWIGRGEAWKAQVAEIEAANADPAIGAKPELLPPPPYPQPSREALQVRMFTSPTIVDHLEVIDGKWPRVVAGLPQDEAAPLPIAIGSEVARLGALAPGDRFVLKPFSGLPQVFELVEVTGIVDAVDDGEKIWGADDPSRMIYVPLETFDAWTQPIPIAAGTDPWARTTRGFTNTTVTQKWTIDFDPAAVAFEDLAAIRSGIVGFRAKVSQESAGKIAANSLLPQLLDQFDVRSVTIGGPILAILALVVGGALYFLVYTAALTVESEGPEIALLKTRGASPWQTTGIHLAQSLTIAVIAAAAAPDVARLLVGLTGRVPPLSNLTGGEPLDVAQVAPITPYVIAGAVATFLAMGLAIIPFARRGVLELRALAARPASSSVWQRYNLDLFAIALSLVVLVQLVQRGFINTTGDEVRLDTMAIIFPVLLLFTGALILLRILPWMLRLIGWAMTKAHGLATALPGWHLGRNPVPYGRLALLVWLTTGLGAFALTYAGTLNRSFDDRAAFVVGTDLRVVADGAGYLTVPDGDRGAAVMRLDGAPRGSSRRAEVLAVRPAEFASVIFWRSDFGAKHPDEILAPLRVDGTPPDLGVELPADATRLLVDGVVIPRSWAEKAELGSREADPSLRLMLKVFDGRGRVWTMQAGSDLVDREWTTVEVDLTSGLNLYPTPPEPPLSIDAIWVERSNPGGPSIINGETFLLTGYRVTGPGGESPIDLAELTSTNELTIESGVPASEAVDAFYSKIPAGETEPTGAIRAASPLNRRGVADRWILPGARSRLDPRVPSLRKIPADLRVLLDRKIAGITGLAVGEKASFSVGSRTLDGEVVGLIDRIPAMNDRRREGRMLLDLDGLSAWLNGAASWSYQTTLERVEAPQELWVKTDDTDAALRRIVAQLPADQPPDAVFTIARRAAQFSSRPIQVGLVAILFVGAVVSVVLALAGVTGYVLLAVARRAHEMGILRALGFPRRGVAATFAIEQVAVLGLGAVIGTFGGIGLMLAMLPFLQLGESATTIEPPILISVDWNVLLGYLGIVSALLVLSVIWATRKVSARRMSEVLREVER